MSGQTHTSDPQILDRRTLQRDHRRLADALRSGMRVLDIGCGTGAIIADVARAVGPEGYVLGIDRDTSLLRLAREHHGNVSNLEFREQDVLSLHLEGQFDIVAASRVLQWIDRPDLAVARMRAGAKRGGLVMALEYNHTQNSWEPSPPKEFQNFYQAWLKWRAANKWENDIADRLPAIFQNCGLTEVAVYAEDEVAERGRPDFSDATRLWLRVIETIGPTLREAGFLSELDRVEAAETYQAWCSHELTRQALVLRAVVGHVS